MFECTTSFGRRATLRAFAVRVFFGFSSRNIATFIHSSCNITFLRALVSLRLDPLGYAQGDCSKGIGLGWWSGEWLEEKKKQPKQNQPVFSFNMFEIQFHEILQMPLHDLHLLQVMFAFYKIDLLATWCPTCSVHIHHLEKQKVQLRQAIQSQDFRECWGRVAFLRTRRGMV